MNYVNSKTPEVVSLNTIRANHPNMSIPDGADLADIGYAKIYPPVAIPEAGPNQVLVSMAPELVDGVWREVILVEDVPPNVPQMVKMRQARLELLERGLLDDVDAIIAAIPDPKIKRQAQIEWEFSDEVHRDNGLVLMLTEQFGMTGQQMDELFISESKR